MANGTVTNIFENTISISFEITIGGAKYLAVVPKVVFDAQITNLDKQNYIINVVANQRRTNRQYESSFPTLIGSSIVIPD